MLENTPTEHRRRHRQDEYRGRTVSLTYFILSVLAALLVGFVIGIYFHD